MNFFSSGFTFLESSLAVFVLPLSKRSQCEFLPGLWYLSWKTLVVQPDLDKKAINSHFVNFESISSNKPYQKQNSSLERQLSSFLVSLSLPKSTTLATSEDIVKFLISKDRTGRTIVHTQSCDRKFVNVPHGLPHREVTCYL